MKGVPVSHDTAASIIASGGDGVSLKRLAWAYGCSRKGCDEERMLRTILVYNVKQLAEDS